jgi:asparagine synthase (glutamine-hydrolysing)
MCGIAGVLNLKTLEPVSLPVLKSMIWTLRHRGPDEFGIYRDDQVGLANARLSIVDLAGGSQPIGNEDGNLWVVYNGEIFNDPELRPGLSARGHTFATHCDTETILHMYEEYGPGCLNHFNGQFAIALWNTHDRSLFLARDRLGVRPLFYTIQNDRLIFGSEIKAILAHPEVRTSIEPQALKQVFTYWSVQSPRTIYAGIYEVPPGHYLLYRDGQVQVTPWWAPDFTEETPACSEEEYLETFEQLLVDATQIRLRADVPVGAYLSGGLDSSTTAALIQKYTNVQLDTFSIAFEHPQYNESEFQTRMAQHLGTQHHVIHCNSADIGQVFPEVIRHTETPILRTSPAPMFLLSRLVNTYHYKVVLTGEGADEFLGGYDIFKEMKIRRFMAQDPDSQLRPMLLGKLYQDIPRISKSSAFLSGFFGRDLANAQSPYFSHQIRWSNTARTLRFFSDTSPAAENGELLPLPDGFSSWSSLAQAQYLEIKTFLSPYLLSSQGDRPAMGNSVEGRYPFLDYRVVAFCNRLPAHLKLSGLNEKFLLRKLGRRLLPDEIWKRPKRPYRAPIQHSFFPNNQTLDYVAEMLSPQAVRQTAFFNPMAVEKLSAKASSSALLSEMEEMALVGILSTQLVAHKLAHPEMDGDEINLPNFKLVDQVIP